MPSGAEGEAEQDVEGVPTMNLVPASTNPQDDVDTYTSTGGLIRLIMRGGFFIGATVIHTPWPWVLRKRWLSAEDVD
jgi:hypothetical protein